MTSYVDEHNHRELVHNAILGAVPPPLPHPPATVVPGTVSKGIRSMTGAWPSNYTPFTAVMPGRKLPGGVVQASR